MNYARLVLAAVAGTVVDAIYGFIVYGTLLRSQFADYPAIYRAPDTAQAYMPALFGGIFIAMLAASFIYAKGYEGRSGAMEGARCGLLLGLFTIGYAVIVNFATIRIGRRFALMMALAALVEWIIDGTVIGLVYKPASTASKRAAAV
jgi:uncharacterized protein DUF1761